MNISELKHLLDSGQFHHATYRNKGTLWEGLHIYVKDRSGFRGYRHYGTFLKDSADLAHAEELTRHTGISVGAF